MLQSLRAKCHSAVIIAMIVCVSHFSSFCCAQDDDQILLNDVTKDQILLDDVNKTKPEETAKPESDTEPSLEEKQAIALAKKRKASAALAAVGAIAILGVGIIAVTMVWAKRLRRLARDPLPVQRTEGNDFWFLKPPKPTVESSDISDKHRPPHPPSSSESSE